MCAFIQKKVFYSPVMNIPCLTLMNASLCVCFNCGLFLMFYILVCLGRQIDFLTLQCVVFGLDFKCFTLKSSHRKENHQRMLLISQLFLLNIN